jgi:phosphinothricin acetyltransferase
MVEIRLATPSDAQGILTIYAPHIQKSFCTFENEVPSLEQFSERINKFVQPRPWLVCIINDVVAGYAYASAHRERVAYQWCCESSVYTHEDFQGKGIGRQLYKALFGILGAQGYRNVYAGITLPNEASIRLHEHCGFTHFATYTNVGYKLGQWKSVGWWQLQLNKYNPKPTPPIPFSEMDGYQYETLLSTAAHHILKKLAY